ncbi:hypothetical protein [Tianweitania sp.]|uniref:hypothetical protein n=1 Tax=Tianweitania sp. TaxID=2021634 RepID=UPI00289F01B4|nr:hypothetical protein [Tianweitania sp.]
MPMRNVRGKARVAFLFDDVYTNTARSTIDRMTVDQSFCVTALVCDRTDLEGNIVLAAEEIKSIICSEHPAWSVHQVNSFDEIQLDYIFYLSPYDEYRPELLRSIEAARRYKVLCISYGVSLLKWSRELEYLCYNPFYANCRAVFVESQHLFPGARKFVPVGITKLEEYTSDIDRTPQPGPMVIAWRPRWSEASSSLSTQIDVVEQILEEDCSASVYLIRHPLFLRQLQLANQTDIVARIEKLESRSRFFVEAGRDYVKRLIHCNVYLGGLSSSVAEFMWSGGRVYIVGSAININKLGSELLGLVRFIPPGASAGSIISQIVSDSNELGNSSAFELPAYDRLFPDWEIRPSARILDYLRSDIDFSNSIRLRRRKLDTARKVVATAVRRLSRLLAVRRGKLG